MARYPRFTVPFKRDDEVDDNFMPTPLTSRKTVSNVNRRFEYQDPEAEQGAGDYRSEIDKLYGTGEAMNKFYEHVQNVPQREDYQPGIFGKIVAGLAGTSAGWQGGAGAGIKTAQSVIRRPYEQAVEEYEMKGQGLKQAADIEQARDAKRVAYLESLRKFDKDAYDRELANTKVNLEAKRTAATQQQAETAAALAKLTEARDKAVDDRERKRIDAQIAQQTANLKIQQQNANTLSARAKSYGTFVEKYGKGQKKQTVKFASPQAMRTAEIDSAQELLNDPKYTTLKPFVNVQSDGVIIDNSGTAGWFGSNVGANKPDADLMKKFKEEWEKKKSNRLNTILGNKANDEDDDVIDLDDEEP